MLVRPKDILVKDPKTVTFEDKILMSLGPKIWNALQQSTKAENPNHKFQEYIYCNIVSQPVII